MLIPTDYIEFEGKKYPVWETDRIDGIDYSVRISVESLKDQLFDEEWENPKDDEAKLIDETIFFYLSDSEVTGLKTEDELVSLVEYYLC